MWGAVRPTGAPLLNAADRNPPGPPTLDCPTAILQSMVASSFVDPGGCRVSKPALGTRDLSDLPS